MPRANIDRRGFDRAPRTLRFTSQSLRRTRLGPNILNEISVGRLGYDRGPIWMLIHTQDRIVNEVSA